MSEKSICRLRPAPAGCSFLTWLGSTSALRYDLCAIIFGLRSENVASWRSEFP
jgi:hypothetical protein